MTEPARPTVCIFQRFMPPDPSGAGKQAVTLARVVRDEGWDVVFLTEESSSEEAIDGIPTYRLRSLPPDPSYVRLLVYWIEVAVMLARLRKRFHVLHVHSMAFEQAGAVPAARLLGKPVLVRSSISGEFNGLQRSKSGRLQKKLLGLAGEFVVLSRRLAEEYREAGLPAEKLNRIPNGVDTARYRPVSDDRKRWLRERLELPQSPRILVYHGVFIERKSLIWLVDILEPRLSELDLTLLLVGGPARDEGDSGYAERLRQRVSRSPAGDRTILRSYDRAVERYLQAADAYVLPSLGEGLPNALLEAMACGLVPFVTRTSGSEDVIEDGESGFLFEPVDEKGLMNAIERVYGPAADRDPKVVAGRASRRIGERFSIQATGAGYVRLYRELQR